MKVGAGLLSLVVAIGGVLGLPGIADAEPSEEGLPGDVPERMLSIYQWAAETSNCSLPWPTLAAVADFASDHGRGDGSSMLEADGLVSPSVFGPRLDGAGGRGLVDDTDGGELDEDPEFDRAVGPFQFIPGTWAEWGADGNGDGVADPNNAWDAARAAAQLLCATGAGSSSTRDDAVNAYFGTEAFAADVLQKTRVLQGVESRSSRRGAPEQLWFGSELEQSFSMAPVREADDDEAAEPVERPWEPADAARDAVVESIIVVGSFGPEEGMWPATFVASPEGGGTFELPTETGVRLVRVGGSGEVPLVGDWDGDGVDDVGLVDISMEARAEFRLISAAGPRTLGVDFDPEVGRRANWVNGDWDGDGIDSPGLIQTSSDAANFQMFDSEGLPYGRQLNVAAPAESQFAVADWDGDGIDTLGQIRLTSAEASDSFVAFDRLGVAQERVLIEAVEDAMLVAGPQPRGLPFDADLEASQEASPVGTVEANDGTPLELWRVRGIVVERSIAEAVLSLLLTAEAEGLSLSGWGYRSHSAQISLRQANCADVWTTPASQCSPPTAVPGTSRHEFGLAIDFTTDGSVLTFGSAEYAWLQENAETFGLFNLPSEPWHWSVTGG